MKAKEDSKMKPSSLTWTMGSIVVPFTEIKYKKIRSEKNNIIHMGTEAL